MREIKYRAWIKPFVNYKGELVQGRMCKVHSIHFGTKRVIITSNGYGNVSIVFENIILEEFTGLTDINGREIYEGDIVHCISRTDNANMVIIFECGEYRMVLSERFSKHITGSGYYNVNCFEKEVIGNIHDNPELLKMEESNHE